MLLRVQKSSINSCFSSSVRIKLPVFASSSPDFSSSFQGAFPNCYLTQLSDIHALELPVTVTGSYRTCTGFSLNPRGTCKIWRQARKFFLFNIHRDGERVKGKSVIQATLSVPCISMRAASGPDSHEICLPGPDTGCPFQADRFHVGPFRGQTHWICMGQTAGFRINKCNHGIDF